MTPGRRLFLENLIARLEIRIEGHRDIPGRNSPAVLDVLERMVARDRAELAAAPPPPAAAPIAETVTWKSPRFIVDGRYSPFHGTYADGMLAIAAVCEKLGCFDLAEGYRAIAEIGIQPAVEDDPAPTPGAVPPRSKSGKRPRSIWNGPNMPPPEPVAFVAGEQMGFAL